jgi:hypothetical protein
MPIQHQSAIFVGVVVGFLNVFSYTPAHPPPSRLNIIFDRKRIPVGERIINGYLHYREFSPVWRKLPFEMA